MAYNRKAGRDAFETTERRREQYVSDIEEGRHPRTKVFPQPVPDETKRRLRDEIKPSNSGGSKARVSDFIRANSPKRYTVHPRQMRPGYIPIAARGRFPEAGPSVTACFLQQFYPTRGRPYGPARTFRFPQKPGSPCRASKSQPPAKRPYG